MGREMCAWIFTAYFVRNNSHYKKQMTMTTSCMNYEFLQDTVSRSPVNTY
jgi:hypothetical protein